MTMFEDRLLGQLVAEHGDRLRAPERPAPARRRVRRPARPTRWPPSPPR